MEKSINLCIQAAQASTEFERYNNELKRQYIIANIMFYNKIVENAKGYNGTFGTGYPFYALKPDLTGQLPFIEEQIRYNNELINATHVWNQDTWPCFNCLAQNASDMPDLKILCKPCRKVIPELKPRKIINRLPDLDMWMVCNCNELDEASQSLSTLFEQNGIYTTDNYPIQSIDYITQINESIKNGQIPQKLLPIDAHIIDKNILSSLIEQVPFILEKSRALNTTPYLPIHPLSYRKIWQYDDAAYNFVHDYLSSMTEFNFGGELNTLLRETRKSIANTYSFDQLYNYLLETGPVSVRRRHKSPELKDRFKERIESWKNY